MTIYLDVLLPSNLFADYALLRTTAALTHAPLRPLRCLLAAAVGADKMTALRRLEAALRKNGKVRVAEVYRRYADDLAAARKR